MRRLALTAGLRPKQRRQPEERRPYSSYRRFRIVVSPTRTRRVSDQRRRHRKVKSKKETRDSRQDNERPTLVQGFRNHGMCDQSENSATRQGLEEDRR